MSKPMQQASSPPRWLSGTVLTIVILLIISLVVKVPYTVETQKEVQTPYDVEETYTETVQTEKDEQIPLLYRLGAASSFNCGNVVNYQRCIVVPVENADTQAGTFRLHCRAETINRKYSDFGEAYIEPGKMKIIECGPFDMKETDDISFEKTITSDPKTVTAFGTEDVTRTRIVTEYKTETYVETETKYRTLLKHLFSGE